MDAPACGSRRTGHDNNFQIIRYFLASLVILSHSFEMLGHYRPFGEWFGVGNQLGMMAVNGFFLVSGCLITASWQRSSSLATYLSKRYLRIVPGFVVAFLVSLFLIGPMAGLRAGDRWADLPWSRNFWSLGTLGMPSASATCSGGLSSQLNLSMWTIRYEFGCYLSVAILGIVGIVARRRLMLALTALMIGGYAAQLGIIDSGLVWVGPLKSLAPVPRLMSYFLVGSCFHLYPVRFTRIGAGVALLVWALGHSLGPVPDQLATLLAGGYLVFACAQAPIPAMRAWNRLPDVSYGLYLYGWPTQVLLIHSWPGIRPLSLFGGAMVLCTLAGVASWYGVERWFVRPRRRMTKAPAPVWEPRLGPSSLSPAA